MSNYLIHYASQYYDPAKAHEYYMKNRKLKGRTTTGLTDEGKDIWTDTKANITETKNKEIHLYNEVKEQKITELRDTATKTRESITAKLQALNEALREKYSEDSKAISDTQKDVLAAKAKAKKEDIERIRDRKDREVADIRSDDSLDSEEKAELIGKETKKANSKIDDVNEDYAEETDNIREANSEKREGLAKTKKDATAVNYATAKEERTKVAADLKTAIQEARDTYTKAKEDTTAKYEDVYQNEYDKIKSQYSKPKK